jgi:glycosyltransferase involved in cell wall biosynthesis
VESTKNLIDTYNQLKEEGLSVMIQEIIPGGDDQFYAYEAYFNENHQPLGIFTKRKVRQYPIHYGIGSFHKSERNEEVMNIGSEFLTKIGYSGFAGIEFKLDARDGKLKFMEINLRTLMSGELPIASGVNLPYIYYKDLCGEKVQKIDHFQEGVKLVDLELDIASFFKYRELKEITFLQWIRSFQGKLVEAYFAWDDLLPSLLVSLRFFRTLTRKTKQLFSGPIEAILPYLEKRNTTVLHLISSNGLFGAEKVMLNIAEGNGANGRKSWVIGLKNRHNPHEEVIGEAKKRDIPAQIIESNGRFDFGAVNRLTQFIRANNIAILHTHNYKANFIGLLAAKKAKIPIVATLHGYIGNGRKLKLYEALDRFILRYFDRVVLVDDSLKKWFKNGSVKYEVINNGVNIHESQGHKVTRSQVKAKLGIDENDLVIGTVGRLSEEKGHKYLIEAFAKLIKDYPNARLLIVGEGELRKELEQLSETLGIKEKVTFTGYQEDVTQYHALMDVYVSPSLVEHFPMSILEAMSFGKAIVATDAGGTAKLIDEKTGIIIKSGSSDQIYQSIAQLLKDNSLRRTLGEQAQRLALEKYSLGQMVDTYKTRIYEPILNT